MCVAAAIVGGGLIGAAGSVIAGKDAANATEKASNNAIAWQEDALKQQKELAQPYTDLGKAAIPLYEDLLGIGKGGTAGIEKTLASLPGYQFTKSEGIGATDAQLSSMGLGKSGNTLEAVDRFTTGLADQTYNSELQNVLAPIQIGQASAAGVGANIGQAATNVGNIAMNQGTNQANIDTSVIAGITKAIGGGVNAYQTDQLIKALT